MQTKFICNTRQICSYFLQKDTVKEWLPIHSLETQILFFSIHG